MEVAAYLHSVASSFFFICSWLSIVVSRKIDFMFVSLGIVFVDLRNL